MRPARPAAAQPVGGAGRAKDRAGGARRGSDARARAAVEGASGAGVRAWVREAVGLRVRLLGGDAAALPERVEAGARRGGRASGVIAQGENVVYVSRQLGHASTSVTLDVYAHLFDRAAQGRRSVERLEEAFGHVVGVDA